MITGSHYSVDSLIEQVKSKAEKTSIEILAKQLILIAALFLSMSAYSQDDKTVTLVVTGQGKTKDVAKQNALRNAIELAFGTFISSNTEILDDELVKDEIVSVSNGNIQDYELLSEVQLSNGDYATSLRATVSVVKLTTFVESKGIVVEFKGGLFASNILIQELYKKNEVEAINNIVTILKEISKESFDYSINAENPFLQNESWSIPITVDVSVNSNFMNIPTLLEQTVRSLSLSSSEVENYSKLNIPVFPLTLLTLNSKGIYYLRNAKSIFYIIDFIYSLNSAIVDFNVFNGIKRKRLSDYGIPGGYTDTGKRIFKSTVQVIDDDFRIILATGCDGGFGTNAAPASLFHNGGRGSSGCSELMNFDYTSVYRGARFPHSFLRHMKPDDLVKYVVSNYSMEKSYGIAIRREKQRPGLSSSTHLFAVSKKSNWYMGDLLKQIKGSYYPLGENTRSRLLGTVISFISVKPNSLVVQFKFHDSATTDEIKNISKYEIKKDRI
ncbi:hypothetical protein [Flagellimonas marinaquae]|uniref:hypothetical protein n=1 Tax=Flagellimonas marinaquae TaxID=254955 RepID=UPI000F8DC9BF|nr:hypothetical protein [Allomuricauda aquimarina]